ncbi:hypothetical protein BY447_3947 [Pantoea sp. JKS000250]|nr:hypothetical protein BY447_3947 [Pantoea sp. JKS000250]
MWHDLSGGQDCSSRVALSVFPAQKTCTACTGFLLKYLAERLLYRFRTAEKKEALRTSGHYHPAKKIF